MPPVGAVVSPCMGDGGGGGDPPTSDASRREKILKGSRIGCPPANSINFVRVLEKSNQLIACTYVGRVYIKTHEARSIYRLVLRASSRSLALFTRHYRLQEVRLTTSQHQNKGVLHESTYRIWYLVDSRQIHHHISMFIVRSKHIEQHDPGLLHTRSYLYAYNYSCFTLVYTINTLLAEKQLGRSCSVGTLSLHVMLYG